MCQEDPLPKILIVDDEENILTMFQRSLRKEYEVLGATSPTEATELLESQKVDAIVVDFELPEISGKEFIKIIRKNRKFDYVPILVLTAHETHMAVTSSFQSGADDFLAKPATVAEVREKLNQLIRSQKFSRTLKQHLSRKKYASPSPSGTQEEDPHQPE